MGQAARARIQRFAGAHAAEFPDTRSGTYKTARPPPDAALFADSVGDADPAADRHAAADRDAACDEPGRHRAADPDTHLGRVHLRREHVGRDHVGRDHVGNAVAALASAGDFAARLSWDFAARPAGLRRPTLAGKA